MANITAQELAASYGHSNGDARTTIKTVENPDADTDSGDAEMMDLRVCGTGPEAFFEWITEYGDPIGDMFDEIDEDELSEGESDDGQTDDAPRDD